jgi:Flp pilus assembly protein TadG
MNPTPSQEAPQPPRLSTGAAAVARLYRCRRGATAVEFALIAVPFFALLIAICQTGLIFLAQEELQTATSQAARLILTGQAQKQGLSAGQFQQDVCGNVAAMLTCSGIYVNVQKFSSFQGMTPLNPVQSGNFDSAALSFQTGGPGDIVLVQTFYQWPVLPGLLGLNLSNMNGNNLLLVGTAVFRNEPYL